MLTRITAILFAMLSLATAEDHFRLSKPKDTGDNDEGLKVFTTTFEPTVCSRPG